MLEATKFIEKKREGDYEYSKYHVIKIEDVTWQELEDVYMDSPEFEDPEDAYCHGVTFDFNNDVVWLDVNPFICWIESYIKDSKGMDEEDIYQDIDKLKNLFERLKKYDGYNIQPPKPEQSKGHKT